MTTDKIACLIINVSTENTKNYVKDNFFSINSVNSFKTWHPDIELFYINDSNKDEFFKKIGLEEYYDSPGILKIQIAEKLMENLHYEKLINLGIDTITCARLDEFINEDGASMLCTLGPPHQLSNELYTTPIYQFQENEKIIYDHFHVNADVVCFNGIDIVKHLLKTTTENWTLSAEEGAMNYMLLKEKHNIKVVDWPYHKTKVLYNVRSKGVVGGYCMVKGKVLAGRNGTVVSDVYPTTKYSIRDNKVFTFDNKQVKCFHFCEALGVRTEKDELTYDEAVNEMKTMWFNSETINFFETQCGCTFK